MRSIPVMLKGDVEDYLDENCGRCKKNVEAFEFLRKWYLSAEQKDRILKEWKKMRFSK